MRSALVPAVATVGFVGLLALVAALNASDLFKDKPQSEARQPAPVQVASVADQQKCDDQADGFYEREGSRVRYQGATAGYIDRYSAKYGKCFITLITSENSQYSEGLSFHTMSIYDVFSGARYASYSSSQQSGRPENVSECWVTLAGGRNVHCSSQAEWKLAAAEYQ
jgi:hypothetical protein